MSNTETVGILGGMGPRATAHFLDLFVKEMNLRGHVQDHEFPRMVTLSLPLRGWGIGGAEDKAIVREQVLEGVEFLVRAGADTVAIPCNSVHEWDSDIRKRCEGIAFVDIIRQTRALVMGETVGVLCSRQTRDAALYGDVLYPEHQEAVDWAIGGVLRGESPPLNWEIHRLLKRGAEVVILGCTELSLCRHGFEGVVIDSSWALAQALAVWAT